MTPYYYGLVTTIFVSFSLTNCENQTVPDYHQVAQIVNKVAINIDKFIDVIIEGIQKGGKNIEPIPLPKVDERFNDKILFVYVNGEFLMRNGNLYNLKSILRYGNATLHYSDMKLFITTGFLFKNLHFEYDFSSRIVSIGPDGFMSGNAKNLIFETVFAYDIRQTKFSLDKIELMDREPVDVYVQVSKAIDWLANPIITWLSNLYEDKILIVIRDAVKTAIEKNLPSSSLLLS